MSAALIPAAGRMPEDRRLDDELMAQVAGGWESALESLISRHRDRLVRMSARLTSDIGHAEDIAQETFMRLSLNSIRSRQRRPEVALEAANDRPSYATPEKALEFKSMAHHPSLLARQAAVDARRLELAELLAAPGVLDEAAVSKSLQEVARLESELDQEVAKNLVELRPLLTEAQKRTLFQHIELRHPRNARPNGGRP